MRASTVYLVGGFAARQAGHSGGRGLDVGGTQDSIAKPRVHRARSLRDIESDVKRACGLLDRVLDELSTMIGADVPRPGPPPPPAGPSLSAKNISLTAVGGGKAALSFDAGKAFLLPEALAQLAAVLVTSEGESDDEFVAWQSLQCIGKRLEKRLPRRFDSHSVSNLLWRLRKVLKRAQLDRLVETRADRGARLRLKRQPVQFLPDGFKQGE